MSDSLDEDGEGEDLNFGRHGSETLDVVEGMSEEELSEVDQTSPRYL